MADTVCLHCEERAATSPAGLCEECADNASIRALYRRRHHWTPAWEAHLRRLTARARQRLPLFEDPA